VTESSPVSILREISSKWRGVIISAVWTWCLL